MSRVNQIKIDWITVILYLLLVLFGWINIISASAGGEITSLIDFSTPYGKHFLFMIISLFLIILILSIEAKFFERFSSIIYLASLLSLAGLFLFGKNINGATSWYAFGGMTLQPSEFAKAATALAVAKYVSDLQTNIKDFKDQLRTFLIIVIPAFLILLQNDAGSTLVYAAFFFVLYREGLPNIYLSIIVFLILVAIGTLKLGTLMSIAIATVIIFGYYFFKRKTNKRLSIIQPISLVIVAMLLSFGVKFFYENILQEHQQDRISLWLRLEKDEKKLEQMKRTILYNLNESEKAISSGGITGKGFMEGTRTTGKFVPEQDTDYIFSTVGEEWGFVGTTGTVLVFVLLLIRILYRAEQQKSQFSRVYGYSVASILFFHFLINTGMVMGLIPTVGIPLPFFSRGGSGLMSFTILLFIFVKLDANKINEW